MPPPFLDISVNVITLSLVAEKDSKNSNFVTVCHIVPDLILYFEILRIHCNVQITNIVFSFQNQDVKINKEFLKDSKVTCVFKTLLSLPIVDKCTSISL